MLSNIFPQKNVSTLYNTNRYNTFEKILKISKYALNFFFVSEWSINLFFSHFSNNIISIVHVSIVTKMSIK